MRYGYIKGRCLFRQQKVLMALPAVRVQFALLPLPIKMFILSKNPNKNTWNNDTPNVWTPRWTNDIDTENEPS